MYHTLCIEVLECLGYNLSMKSAKGFYTCPLSGTPEMVFQQTTKSSIKVV